MKVFSIVITFILIISCVKKDKIVSIAQPTIAGGENASIEVIIQSIPGTVSTQGVFDPSVEYEASASKLWMSYSAVADSPSWPSATYRGVSTRIAYSTDSGSTWTDYGPINTFVEVDPAAGAPEPAVIGTYNHEVSTLVYDSRDEAKPWRVIWFKYYLQSSNSNKLATHMSINMKSASTPENLAGAAEQNLFFGSFFAGNAAGGIQLNTLHADLNKCIAFTEPGAVATGSALYVVLGCLHALGQKQDVVLLKFTGNSTNTQNIANWSYVGTLLESDNASSINPTYIKFTGHEIEKVGNTHYLLTTPTLNTPFADFYNDCLIYEVPDLDTPTANYHSTLSVTHGANNFHGACTYNSNGSNAGIMYIYSNAGVVGEDLFFKIMASGDNL